MEGGTVVGQAGFLQAARQHGGIFDRHRRTLRHMRFHGVAGVAEQHHAAFAPQRQRFAVQQWPFGDLLAGLDQRLHDRVITGEGFVHFFAAAVDEAALEIPRRVGHAADVIVFVAFLRGVIDHQVAIRRPPLHAVFEAQIVFGQFLAADQCAVGHPAAVGGRFDAQQVFANA
ncbi:hypothetical protein D3C79_657490 [compost metagenome]